jgi:hypothetical protein
MLLFGQSAKVIQWSYRYFREGDSGEGYPPAKSRSQVRWAKRALEELGAGRGVKTQMCIEEIKALAATPEDGMPGVRLI